MNEFSRRYGYEPLPKAMQLEEISGDLRREIWDEVRQMLLRYRMYGTSHYYFHSKVQSLVERVLGEFLKRPRDEINTAYARVMDDCKSIVMDGVFHRVLDFLEILVPASERAGIRGLADTVEGLFERHVAAYRFDASAYQFIPCANKEQGDAVEKAIETLREDGMAGATTHLGDAAGHINSGQFADSIADSIHAVESVARVLDPKASKGLRPALNSLERAGELKHPMLKEAFLKLYNYTSDEEGIRHALLEREAADVGLEEAVFMFGACASFAAYLTGKHRQMGEI